MDNALVEVKQYAEKYIYNTASPILAIGERTPVLISNAALITHCSKIISLRAYANINSVNEAELPNFDFEDTESTKLQKILDLEWQSPRLQLNLYIGEPNNWILLGSSSLLNPTGYPYRYYNLLDLYTDAAESYIAEDKQLGIEVQDVGYGNFNNDTDSLTIHCEILRTINYILV